MITEDYVSLEVAKLLKKKGFDEPSLFHCIEENNVITQNNEGKCFRNSELKNAFSVPTQALVLKWLRDVHNLTVVCLPYMPWNAYETSFAAIHGGPVYKGLIFKDVFMHHTEEPIWAETYEVTCNAIIKYCLENLI